MTLPWQAAKNPEKPVIWTILLESAVFGVLEAVMSLAFFYTTGFVTHGADPYPTTTAQQPYKAAATAPGYKMGTPATYPRQRYILEMMSDGNDSNPHTWHNYKYMTGGDASKFPYDKCMAFIGGCGSAWNAANNGKGYSSMPKSYPDNIQECFTSPNAQWCGLRPPGMPWAGDATCPCTEIMTCALFIQIFVSAELLIFPMRSLGWFWTSMAAPLLYVTVIGSCILFTILAALGAPEVIFRETLGWHNAAWAWLWAIIGLFIMDCAKKASRNAHI